MLVDLRTRGSWRDHLLLTCQAIVPTLLVLMTTVSCSAPATNGPEPRRGVVERELSFSGRLTDGENRQLAQRKLDVQQIRRQKQYRTSASPKVVSRHVEKANTPPLLDAKKEQLFQEFMEWRRRHRDRP
jgi:hypothetical protein